MNDIFLSRPNWVPPKFQNGLDSFLRYLGTQSMTPRTIGKTDFPNKNPLGEVIELMNKCDGCIVLGYPQVFMQEGSIKDESAKGIEFATEWNHIETGLAYAKGLPLLIIHHDTISRGVFDRGASDSFLNRIDLKNPAWVIDEQIVGAISNWKTKVDAYKNVSKKTCDSGVKLLNENEELILRLLDSNDEKITTIDVIRKSKLRKNLVEAILYKLLQKSFVDCDNLVHDIEYDTGADGTYWKISSDGVFYLEDLRNRHK